MTNRLSYVSSSIFPVVTVIVGVMMLVGCLASANQDNDTSPKVITAKDILGNPNYQAISYGGYRQNTRDIQPTISELKEDMRILSAMGIRILRTYNTHLAQASNLLKAISEMKSEDPSFEMYVMLGAWINCEGAWGPNPNHEAEDEEGNAAEIQRAVAMANAYPDIVKVIAVGNEAMVHWAAGYFVKPDVILKWVNHLQDLKSNGQLANDVWITSSDNFASWGGGETEYHNDDLNQLIKAVDFISMHTYPMHDTHYNPQFWGVESSEKDYSKIDATNAAMIRARDYAIAQYDSTKAYVHRISPQKPIHIGETGWASAANHLYGADGSKACDEYKEGLYYKMMRDWTDSNNISCFYFEAFDETWKDGGNPGGSENHFGLFTIDGQAKYAIWSFIDSNETQGLTRNGQPLSKTYGGDKDLLLQNVEFPPTMK